MIGARAGKGKPSGRTRANHGHVGERHIDGVLDRVQQLNDHIRHVLERQLPLGGTRELTHVQRVEQKRLC